MKHPNQNNFKKHFELRRNPAEDKDPEDSPVRRRARQKEPKELSAATQAALNEIEMISTIEEFAAACQAADDRNRRAPAPAWMRENAKMFSANMDDEDG